MPIRFAPLKRPPSRLPSSGDPVKNAKTLDLEAMASQAIYIPSDKHKRGVFTDQSGHRQIGKPGVRATTVDEAEEEKPSPPFTMICPERWNGRHPSREATTLLRQAIRRGQIGHPMTDGLPQWVWARDPEDPKTVYAARRLSVPANGYKAYPLTENQVLLLRLEVR